MTLQSTLLFLAALAASQQFLLADEKKSTTAPQTLVIPAGAVEAGPFTWKHTDANGKKWIYRKTPFGVTRSEEMPEPAAPAAPGPEERTRSWKVVENGDKVTFENGSPFGPQRWTKTKSELNEEEKAALARAQREAAAKTAKAPAKNTEGKN